MFKSQNPSHLLFGCFIFEIELFDQSDSLLRGQRRDLTGIIQVFTNMYGGDFKVSGIFYRFRCV